MKVLAIAVCMAALAACSADVGDAPPPGGGVKPDDYAPAEHVDSLNRLERALDPIRGGQQAWLEFEDHGGLAHISDYYGLHVRGHSVRFGAQGELARVQLLLSPNSAPMEMREVLQGVCGINPADWGKSMAYVEASDGQAAAGEFCDAFYARINGDWNVVMMRCDVEMAEASPDRRNCEDFGR